MNRRLYTTSVIQQGGVLYNGLDCDKLPRTIKRAHRSGASDMDFKLGLASVLALVALSGCAVNNYERFYISDDVGYDLSINRVAPAPEQPFVSRIPYKEFKATTQALKRRGFELLGYSSFQTSDGTPDSMAIEQAKRLGADLVVIINPEHAGSYETTEKVSEQIGTAQSRTTITDRKGRSTGETATTESAVYATRYVPRTVNLISYGALYWVRTKWGIGISLKEMTDEQKKARQTNAGIQIGMIISDSPAERADLMMDDIIESVDGKRITNDRDFAALSYVPGQVMKFVITRGDKKLEKTLIAGEQRKFMPSPRS